MSTTDQWLVRAGSTIHGPVPTETLREMAQTGPIEPTTPVCKVSEGKWNPALEVTEIAQIVAERYGVEIPAEPPPASELHEEGTESATASNEMVETEETENVQREPEPSVDVGATSPSDPDSSGDDLVDESPVSQGEDESESQAEDEFDHSEDEAPVFEGLPDEDEPFNDESGASDELDLFGIETSADENVASDESDGLHDPEATFLVDADALENDAASNDFDELTERLSAAAKSEEPVTAEYSDSIDDISFDAIVESPEPVEEESQGADELFDESPYDGPSFDDESYEEEPYFNDEPEIESSSAGGRVADIAQLSDERDIVDQDSGERPIIKLDVDDPEPTQRGKRREHRRKPSSRQSQSSGLHKTRIAVLIGNAIVFLGLALPWRYYRYDAETLIDFYGGVTLEAWLFALLISPAGLCAAIGQRSMPPSFGASIGVFVFGLLGSAFGGLCFMLVLNDDKAVWGIGLPVQLAGAVVTLLLGVHLLTGVSREPSSNEKFNDKDSSFDE